MRDFILSLLGGIVVGVIFSIVKLPLPAPPLVGIFGMFGIFIGGIVMDSVFRKKVDTVDTIEA